MAQKHSDSVSSSLNSLLIERAQVAAKLDSLDDAIKALQRIAGKGVSASVRAAAAPRTSPTWSPAAKAAVSKRMKKYWAERKRKENAKRSRRKKPSPTALLGGPAGPVLEPAPLPAL